MPRTLCSSMTPTASSSIPGFESVLTTRRMLPAAQAASCAPRMTAPAYGVVAMASVTNPIIRDPPRRSPSTLAGLFVNRRTDRTPSARRTAAASP